jgi:hypothetical protein
LTFPSVASEHNSFSRLSRSSRHPAHILSYPPCALWAHLDAPMFVVSCLIGVRLYYVAPWAFGEVPPSGLKRPKRVDRPQTAVLQVKNTGLCAKCTALCQKWSFREGLFGRRKNPNRLKSLVEALHYKE